MKKFLLLLVPVSAYAGGPAASARNPELLAFEGIVIGVIILVLGSETGWKWMKRKVSDRRQNSQSDRSGNIS